MNIMSYKGYAARIEYSDDDACFIGHIAGIRDIVGFHGESVLELRQAFEEAVDDYVATCEKLKRTPQRGFSCPAPGAGAGGCRTGSSRRSRGWRAAGFRSGDDACIAP